MKPPIKNPILFLFLFHQMSLNLYSSLLEERDIIDRRIRALRVKTIRRDAKNPTIRTDEFMDLFNHLNNLIYNLSYNEEFDETLDKLEEKIEEFYDQLAT